MIVIGTPVLEKKELTKEFLDSVAKTVANPAELLVILIDNGSKDPYKVEDYNVPFTLLIKRNEVNEGFYLPMQWLYETHGTAEIIGLCHNDIYFYEKGWDNRLRQVFINDSKLALVGFCGSSVVDPAGGRGLGTISNFKGIKGAVAGSKRQDLVPCALLDSLAMFFRTSAIPLLRIDNNITPCHFYDKIWSMRILENRLRVAMLGIEIDHIGGTTSCSPAYQEDAKRWCKEHNVAIVKNTDGSESGDLALYKEGERRFLEEYKDRKKIIPCRIDASYNSWRF